MPVKIQSVGKGKYRVSTPHGTKAKHTTLAKAKSQERLLNAIDHGWKPTGQQSKKKTSTESLALEVVGILLNESGELKSRIAHFLIDDVDSDYTFYSRVSRYLCGTVLRDEDDWESADGQELIDELLSKCPESKIKSLLKKFQED
jgi:hypothetical protein